MSNVDNQLETGFDISLDFITEAIGHKIKHADITAMSHGNSGAVKARVSGESSAGMFSVVVKIRKPGLVHKALWYAGDQRMVDREYFVYEILDILQVPHARVLSRFYNSSDDWGLVLEDLNEHYILPEDSQHFSQQDQMMIMETYAAIHASFLKKSSSISTSLLECLQPEEGSQITQETSYFVFATLNDYDANGYRLSHNEYLEAVNALLTCRNHWRDEPRTLVFNDFDAENVALPRTSDGSAVLFDWELAGTALPQFDLINTGHGNVPNLDPAASHYVDCLRRNGVEIDQEKFIGGMKYAALSMNFYALWLLHLKLSADPQGKLPKWMIMTAETLFNGGLIRSAVDAMQFKIKP